MFVVDVKTKKILRRFTEEEEDPTDGPALREMMVGAMLYLEIGRRTVAFEVFGLNEGGHVSTGPTRVGRSPSSPPPPKSSSSACAKLPYVPVDERVVG